MIRRGVVWIGPEGYVPPGRMIEPDAADLWASWQDDPGELEEALIRGAAAAVEWGRERSDVVMIRLGHSAGSYFSAGERHPAGEEDSEERVPHWPPAGPPPEGWWSRPPFPTLEDVKAAAGDMSKAEAAAWAVERLAIFTPDLEERDLPTLRALFELTR